MRTFVQPGDALTLTAPAGGVTRGTGYQIGRLFVVAFDSASAGASFVGYSEGVHDLAKTSAQAWAEGDPIYWDATNARCDSDASKGSRIGVAAAVAANPSSTGYVRLDGASGERAVGVAATGTPAPTSLATAGAETYTAAQVLSGVIVRDPAGASRTDTFPTAALLVAAVPGAKVGDMIMVLIVNGADAAETITLAAGAGGGFDANQTAASRIIAQNASKLVYVRLTNVTAASEAYVMYA